jgi:hypothetical protein
LPQDRGLDEDLHRPQLLPGHKTRRPFHLHPITRFPRYSLHSEHWAAIPHLDFDQDHQHSLGVGTIALFRDLRTRLTFHLRHNQLQTSESVTVCIRFLPIDCVVRPHLNCCGLRLHQEYLLTLAAKTSNGPLDRQTIRSLSHDSVWPTGSSNIRASILFYSCQPNLRAAGIQEILLSENKRGAADYLFRPRFLRPLTSHASG